MSPLAALANGAWITAGVPAWVRFRRALSAPETTQRGLLRRQLQAQSATAYGRELGFGAIGSYEEFRRRVPVVSYDALLPWIGRIMQGEAGILTREPVTRLMPTSGSTGARKLIPFTEGLQRDFNEAIGPWLIDLAQRYPGIVGGPAYWSVTPAAQTPQAELSAVPIGFADDSEYLGGFRHRLIEAAMAAPSTLRNVPDMQTFRRLVLLHLLRREDLRLISVWHPSFLTLLMDALPPLWDELLGAIAKGDAGLPPLPKRAARLLQANPARPETLWPALRVVSCWGDAHARLPSDALEAAFPGAVVQPKGLLSTEAFVTLPFAGQHPLAITSHVFEFIDEEGELLPAWELRLGGRYEVVVTTSGGLWRYRTGDQVEVRGFVQRTPSLRFLGRVGRVSDLCGEKLTDAFVGQVLRDVLGTAARFAMLAPHERGCAQWGYTLYVEGRLPDDAAARVDQSLRANPHYAYCRDLGQLASIDIFSVEKDAYALFAAVEMEQGARLGDIKATALSVRTDWHRRFSKHPAQTSTTSEA